MVSGTPARLTFSGVTPLRKGFEINDREKYSKYDVYLRTVIWNNSYKFWLKMCFQKSPGTTGGPQMKFSIPRNPSLGNSKSYFRSNCLFIEETRQVLNWIRDCCKDWYVKRGFVFMVVNEGCLLQQNHLILILEPTS